MTQPPVRTRTRPHPQSNPQPQPAPQHPPKPAPVPYQVGYGKPPKNGQFKKGGRGGPGRPKGSKSLIAELEKLLGQTIVATVNGRQLKMTQRQALLRRLLDQALKGHFASLTLLLKLEGMAQPDAPAEMQSSAAPRPGLAPDEHRLLKEHLDRMKSRNARTDQ